MSTSGRSSSPYDAPRTPGRVALDIGQDDSSEINPVALRKRTLEEVMQYLSNKYPDYRMAIVYSNYAWFVMCDDGNGPIEIQVSDVKEMSMYLSLAVSTVVTGDNHD